MSGGLRGGRLDALALRFGCLLSPVIRAFDHQFVQQIGTPAATTVRCAIAKVPK